MRTRRREQGTPPSGPVIPWQDAATDAERKELMKAAGVGISRYQAPALPPVIRRVGAGPRGRFPGRVALEARVRPHAVMFAAWPMVVVWSFLRCSRA